MATIETAEGQTLIVEHESSDPRLWIEARVSAGKSVAKGREMKMFELFKLNALPIDERPRSRSDLTAETMGLIADLLVGWEVAKGRAERRSDVVIEELTVTERDSAKKARPPYVPKWEDDWPAEGSASEKVRWMLDEMPTYSEEEMAVIAGCSRSLISDIKKERE